MDVFAIFATRVATTLKDLYPEVTEETLSRLRARQTQIDATAVAMAEMEQSGDPAALADKLAAAGCGAPTTTNADAVLEMLRQRMQVPA